MVDIAIRPFEIKDMTAVMGVILPIQREEFGIAVTAEEQPDLAAIPAFYQSGNGNFWVAQADGVIVGTIGLKDIGNRQAALRKMFVAADFRGGGHGLAGRLLKTLLEHAVRQDVAEIYLGTTAKFLAAHRFYEKNGFEEITKLALPAAFPIMAVDTKFYRTLLSGAR